jgi:hypothetical protein
VHDTDDLAQFVDPGRHTEITAGPRDIHRVLRFTWPPHVSTACRTTTCTNKPICIVANKLPPPLRPTKAERDK